MRDSSGLTRHPFGAVTVIGLLKPSLKGMSGLVSADLMAASVAETVEAHGQLRLRVTWPQVPLKSTAMLSPAMVTAALTDERLVVEPIVVDRILAMIGAVGDGLAAPRGSGAPNSSSARSWRAQRRSAP